MRSISRMFWSVVILMALWLAAFIYFVMQIDRHPFDEQTRAEGIVVLTGGSGRVEYGFELLASGYGDALFISGVNEKVPQDDIFKNLPLFTRHMVGALSGGRITLGRAAENTIGNAEESTQWIHERGYHHILLVTSDYHMPRALTEFKMMLHDDVMITPAAIDSGNYRNFSWLTDHATRNLVLSEFHKLLAAKLRHLIIMFS